LIETPPNGHALAAGNDLAELEALVDYLTDKVRALLSTYAGAV
jgi:hypothetical protein